MKLATFTHDGTTRIGVVDGDEIVDLTAAAPSLPREMVAFLEAGSDALIAAANATESDNRIPLGEVHLEAPIARPPKFLAVGLNYADHVAEAGIDWENDNSMEKSIIGSEGLGAHPTNGIVFSANEREGSITMYRAKWAAGE